MADYDQLREAELVAIADLLRGFSDAQWDHDTLCAGWRVRDVVSHMTLGYTTPMPSMVSKVARHGFNVPKASAVESVAYGSEHTPAEILATFETIPAQHIRKGISKLIPAREGLVDHVVHHQDIRRPLAMPRVIPEERLVAALDAAPGISGFIGAKKRAGSIRLTATDVDWTHGEGPEVRGTGEAILLTLTGRRVALDELEGDGVATLATRVS